VTAVVLGCDISCATVGQGHRLECLRRGCEGIFGSKRYEVTVGRDECEKRNLMICTAHQILFG
jgi:hypothetical protein